MLWIESSLNDLYQSSVEAFPNTTKRQHAVDPINIVHLEWIPFLGMKTLFVKGIAQNGEKEYSPIVVFKRVTYHETEAGCISLKAKDGTYFLEQLSSEDTDVLVRCDCPDFGFRFKYYDHLDKSLHGHKGKKYQGQGLWEANPHHLPGMCKHVIKLWKVLSESTIIA